MKKIIFLLSILFVSVLLASVVYAETNKDKRESDEWRRWATSTASTTPTSTPSLNLPCVQTAVTTRESAVINAYNTMSASITTALTTRQSELTAAWGLTDNQARRVARKTAWDKFNKAVKEARKVYKASIKTVWKTFATDSKACKVNTQGIESSSADLSL